MRLLLFFLVGCPFVGEREMLERLDADGDSFLMGDDLGEDCDDSNPDIHPETVEVCGDGVDQNCDTSYGDCDLSGSFGLAQADAILYGENHVDLAGYFLATGHDFNGDGGDDLVIGALGVNEGEVTGYAGAVYLVWSGGQ